MVEVTATAAVAHPPAAVFAFLSDLHNHWLLEDRFVELDALGPAGGLVRMKGPFGVSRVARTRVVATDEPTSLRGIAEIGRGTRAAVRWEIVPAGSGSRVTLSAGVERTSAFDRLLLAVGGRRWLQELFRSAVERLDSILAKPMR